MSVEKGWGVTSQVRSIYASWASAAMGTLRGDGVFAALGKNLFDLSVRAGNDVY